MLRILLAPNPSPMTLDGTQTYVVGHRRPAVIDPGPDDPTHLEAILRVLDGAVPTAILLTHDHPDHAALADKLATETGAPVSREDVETDAGSIRAVPTPGHTPDHVCFAWEGAWFVGDLFMGEGDTTLVASPEGDLAAYLESLERVREAAPRVLYPAHGPAISDSAEAVARYQRHREERIAQLREAVQRTGSMDPDALVRAVYGAGLNPALRSAARGSLQAILDYLG